MLDMGLLKDAANICLKNTIQSLTLILLIRKWIDTAMLSLQLEIYVQGQQMLYSTMQ